MCSVSCEVNVFGSPECFCLPGHDGPLCDSCLPGFFGSPPEWRCTSCDCNENIDFDTPGSCDQQTGVCLMCINNSTGPECELCADGYYGDATIQDCRPCNCNTEGSVNSSCDAEGRCDCLLGVGGLKCDDCLVSMSVYLSLCVTDSVDLCMYRLNPYNNAARECKHWKI